VPFAWASMVADVRPSRIVWNPCCRARDR